MKIQFFTVTLIVAIAAGGLAGCKKDAEVNNPSTATAATETTAAASDAPKAFDTMPEVGTKATCPVSGEVFTVKDGTPSSEYEGKVYVFCCPGCKPKFDENPAQYL